MICPPSEEKMNSAGPMPALDLSTKPLVGLNTWPVGAGVHRRQRDRQSLDRRAVGPPGLTGYTVATLVPLSATHSGVVGPKARPQGFFRLGSTICAPTVVRSETRLVWRNSLSGPWVRADAAGAATDTASAAGTATASTAVAKDRSLGNRDDMGTSSSSRKGRDPTPMPYSGPAHTANSLPGRRAAHALKLPTHLNTDERPCRLNERAESDNFANRRAHQHTPAGLAVGDADDLGAGGGRP